MMRSLQRLLVYAELVSLLFVVALLMEGCHPKEDQDRLTKVYGRVSDQAGLPVDSVTIDMLGRKGVLGGIPIDKVYTNQKGEYELVVDVPKEYSSVGVQVNFEYRSLLDKYYNQLIYKDGVQQGSCCNVTMGGKTNYDFVLLPK